ncbi:hypothetical protein HPB50_012696 [Hyalomma asiaticum]|uniref:Uncharacterized protein n=1 Tax=Hyalomma asiaticum TaxID=266040 RepID=A0ACB7T275_HYAAI|nr:hypothetical protein HPB50_012696 [Hyalomma asiaticum]
MSGDSLNSTDKGFSSFSIEKLLPDPRSMEWQQATTADTATPVFRGVPTSSSSTDTYATQVLAKHDGYEAFRPPDTVWARRASDVTARTTGRVTSGASARLGAASARIHQG